VYDPGPATGYANGLLIKDTNQLMVIGSESVYLATRFPFQH